MIFTSSLHPEWKQLVEQTKDAPYGHLYSHEDLARILQVEPHSPRYYALIQKWKTDLRRRHQRCAEQERATGYRILLPNQHIGAMRDWVNRAGRRLKRAVEIGLATPTDKLTAEENLKLGNSLAKHGAVLSMLRRSQYETRPSLAATALPDHPKVLKKD